MNENCFKMGFNMKHYADLIPEPQSYLKNDQILNYNQYKKGNVDNCIWVKHVPTPDEIASHDFQEQEVRRILKTGVYIAIKEQVLWIPPKLYCSLQYGKAGAVDVQFRLNRLQAEYAKIKARNNPGCMGTLLLKGRGFGETTAEIMNGFIECFEGNIDTGGVGIQSYSLEAARNPCWTYAQTFWQSFPQWLKELLCSDFVSGNNIAEKMQWQRTADETKGIKARNVLLKYYPSGTPMDGKHDLKSILLDEICKWEECSFYHVFTNYKKIIMPGFERRGMFSMFSSPADRDCESNKEVYELWKDSDTNEIDSDTGTTKSRIHRYYANPLHGIPGAYDKWGDADPEKIYEHIMRERKKVPKDKLLAEIRGFPLNEREMFESSEGGDFWDNREGLKQRQIYLLNRQYKNEETKEPVRVFGNLEWKDGVVDHPDGVEFRQSDVSDFDVNIGRWSFSKHPQNLQPLKNIFNPPDYPESIIGADPFGKRYAGKKFSNGAAVAYKFRDVLETGFTKEFYGLYLNRPFHEDIFHEDILKGCIYTQSMLQFENNHDKLGNYFSDRNYKNWVIPAIGEKAGSNKLGDGISARGKFMDEMIGLLNSYINNPINANEVCKLEKMWFSHLVDDLLAFNIKDTHDNDCVMAAGQALMGAAKLLFKKTRHTSPEFAQAFKNSFG